MSDDQNDHDKQDGPFRHWHLQRDEDGIAWLHFDKADSSANTLGTEVLEEFDQILDQLQEKLPAAIAIRSSKPAGFCAGADIEQFKTFDATEARVLLRRGHEVMDRLEDLKCPTLALVHGHCLGGGLELALACDYRIGVKGSLQMGLPEIMLGLHPGLGGTFRLTRLINPVTAMTMMLTGKPAYGSQCKQRGLVREIVEERHADTAVRTLLRKKPKQRDFPVKHRFMSLKPVRTLAARQMRKEAARKAPPEHYPAPNALIQLWLEHGGNRDDMQKAEMESFANLLESETSRNLVRVFFLRQGLKEQARGDSGIEHVHVVGAGAMGGDIAAWCALQGCRVTLSDMKNEPIGEAIKAARSLCKSKHKSGAETRAIMDRLIPDPQGVGVERADLVLEAVPENLELKRKVYQTLEPRLKEGALLATNTSSIPLERLAETLDDPSRLVGVHFFNPVAKMMVVEIVSHERISTMTRDRALHFSAGIGKLPVAVNSYPGFLVNRALTPYLMEAIVLMDEGVNKERIDHAAEAFGMPMGPVELADQVGLDICLHVADVLRTALEKPMPATPDWLKEKVDNGELGRKTGEGFYQWQKGRAQKAQVELDDSETDSELRDRLILPMLNACVECHREGVVQDLDHLDAAMIFATGFAPFTGGPIHYARERGIPEVVARLRELAERHGERFTPDPGWEALSSDTLDAGPSQPEAGTEPEPEADQSGPA